jgi:hypothetical protein
MRYTITDEMPPELHNLIGRKVAHAGIYIEAGTKGEVGNIIVRFEGGFLSQAIVVHGPPASDLLAAQQPVAESKRPAAAIASGDDYN